MEVSLVGLVLPLLAASVRSGTAPGEFRKCVPYSVIANTSLRKTKAEINAAGAVQDRTNGFGRRGVLQRPSGSNRLAPARRRCLKLLLSIPRPLVKPRSKCL